MPLYQRGYTAGGFYPLKNPALPLSCGAEMVNDEPGTF